jgi:hypothetical protein
MNNSFMIDDHNTSMLTNVDTARSNVGMLNPSVCHTAMVNAGRVFSRQAKLHKE